MALKGILFVLFLWSLSSNIDAMRWIEDLELEEELKLLNKPAIEIIETVYGDTYGCVDFYEQPAFDHPSLKDHKYNYKMPKRRIEKDTSHLLHPKNIWLNGKGCPDGTVPIKRSSKGDLIRAKQAAKIFSSKYEPQTDSNPGVHYAVLTTKTKNNHHRYNGASMATSIYNPQVQDNQFSASHMLLRNGVESIEVGWIVHPSLYKDHQTRLFIYTNSQQGNCFNTDCPGFILYSTEIPLDNVFHQTSIRGGPFYETQFLIQKDPLNGDWFLTLEADIQLGSWPSRIFNSLSDTAIYVEWGGETYSPETVPSPPMGSGTTTYHGDTRQDAYCKLLGIVDENYKLVHARDLLPYPDPELYYYVWDKGYVNEQYGHLAMFGGKGGYTGP